MPGLWVAGIAGVVFALLAAPGLTWLDAGELGAAAAELGVAHPPGYATFSLLHALVMRVVPLGDVAFRGNLASGLLGAAAVGFAASAARALGARALPAALGALLPVLAPLWLLHATTIEVYTGAAAWTAVMAWAVIRAATDGDARFAVGAAFGVGLAAGHHAELRLFVLLLVPAALWFGWRHRRAAVAACVAGLLGATVVLYLPLRAAAGPWRNWGDPSSPGALWDHVMGARIRLAYASQFGAFDPEAFATFGGQLWSMAPVLLVIGLVGLGLAARRPGGWWLALIWPVDALYSAALNPMGLVDLQNGVPGLLALAVGAGLTLDRLGRPAVVGAVGAAGLALSAWVALPHLGDATGDRGLPLVLDALDDGAPPEAIVAVVSDSWAAGAAFRQVVEGARPDLAVLVRQHAWDASSVGPVQRRLPEALAGWRGEAGLASVGALATWPVVWEWSAGMDAAARPADLTPSWPFFARPGVGAARFEADLVDAATRLGPEGLREPQARRGLAGLAADLGHQQGANGRWAEATRAFEAATRLEPTSASRWTNLGQAQLRAREPRAALESSRRAWALDVGAVREGCNLARLLIQSAGYAEAVSVLDEVVISHPEAADPWALRGVARANGGDLAGAAEDFRAAVTLDPAQPEAQAGLARLRSMQNR